MCPAGLHCFQIIEYNEYFIGQQVYATLYVLLSSSPIVEQAGTQTKISSGCCSLLS